MLDLPNSLFLELLKIRLRIKKNVFLTEESLIVVINLCFS